MEQEGGGVRGRRSKREKEQEEVGARGRRMKREKEEEGEGARGRGTSGRFQQGRRAERK